MSTVENDLSALSSYGWSYGLARRTGKERNRPVRRRCRWFRFLLWTLFVVMTTTGFGLGSCGIRAIFPEASLDIRRPDSITEG
jgi:hypothetical protein